MKKFKKQAIKHAKKAWKKLRPKPHMSRFQKIWRRVAQAAVVGALSLFGLGFLYFVYLLIILPNPGSLRDLNLTESTLIFDREENLLYAIHGDENRKSLESLDEISPWLIDATMAIEDDQFYDHFGVDVPGLVKAVLSEVGVGSARGGSTITQQFARRALLDDFSRTYSRKAKEIVLAMMVELKFNKDEIMLMYLNAISYGGNAYGVQLAAERYFGKDASELTLAESAILAGIPQRPTHYWPYGSYRHTSLNIELTEETLGEREITGESDLDSDEFTRGLLGQTYTMPDESTFYLKGRSDLVLDRMIELGMISEEEYDEALEELASMEFEENTGNIKAPHFVLWVKQLLEEKYGTAVIQEGGLKVYTTLDPEFQEAAETAIDTYWESNWTNYNAKNAAMVSIHPQTGQILAMVGSADYFDLEGEIDGQVNMITSNRQLGSTMKPFVYAMAFLNQFSPSTVVYDVSTHFGGGYRPGNYDGTFLGPVSMRYALAQSRNIPAVKAYFMAGSEDALVPFLRELGLGSIKEDWGYGSTLALGTAEVTPLEVAEAYTVLANGGKQIDPTPILKIENADGEVLEMWEEKNLVAEQVLDPEITFLVNDILSDPAVNLGPSVRVESLDNAAKTGTSSKPTESGGERPGNTWLAAYTPNLVTITWAGNADGEAMNYNASGYNTAAPIWKAYQTSILDRMEPTTWDRPEGIKEVAVSKASGKLPNENTPSDMITTEVFASFAVPTEVDDSFRRVKVETVTDRLATPYSPEDKVEEKTFRVHRSPLADRYPNWQSAIDSWAAGEADDEESTYEFAPTEYAEDIHNEFTSGNLPEIVITEPLSLAALDPEDRVHEVVVDLISIGNGMGIVEFFVDDTLHYTSEESPFEGKIRIPVTAGTGSILEIKAKATDQYGYSQSSTIQVRIGEGGEEPEEEEEETEETEEEESDDSGDE